MLLFQHKLVCFEDFSFSRLSVSKDLEKDGSVDETTLLRIDSMCDCEPSFKSYRDNVTPVDQTNFSKKRKKN